MFATMHIYEYLGSLLMHISVHSTRSRFTKCVLEFTETRVSVLLDRLHYRFFWNFITRDRCECGHQLDPSGEVHFVPHSNGMSNYSVSGDANATAGGALWKSDDSCTREMPTNAFGYLRFQYTSELVSQVIIYRLSLYQSLIFWFQIDN